MTNAAEKEDFFNRFDYYIDRSILVPKRPFKNAQDGKFEITVRKEIFGVEKKFYADAIAINKRKFRDIAIVFKGVNLPKELRKFAMIFPFSSWTFVK